MFGGILLSGPRDKASLSKPEKAFSQVIKDVEIVST